ncbi:MAG: FkbM family methyltransferase, partial [Starkeya sp.]|nr:FkbM family methyltransferase [Starkeya sp.]
SSASFFSSQYNKVPTDDEARDIWEHYWPIQAGELLIDVGAGIGEHVVYLSRRVGPGGKVIAIEAHPRTFRCLEKTIAASGLANVVARQLALSDSEGQVTMEDEAGYVSNRIGAGSLTVTACTLDSLLDGLNGAVPSVVKMNIEGAETAALRGATRALQAVPR